jgi:hypothetical protein
MEGWVGPAIIAAIVSGVVSAAGWFVNSWQAMRLEQRRREEKVHDFQVALRAEIASDLLVLEVSDNGGTFAAIEAGYDADANYRPFVAHLADNVIFTALVDQIHVLPGEVIEPIVQYARLRQVLQKFSEDLRRAVAESIPVERALLMFSDYLASLDRLQALARRAVVALDRSINRPDAAPPTRASASAPAEGALVSSERKDEP